MNLKKLKEFGCDGLACSGAGCFAYGLWLAWHPLGFIAGGLCLSAVGIFLGYDPTALRGGIGRRS